MFLAGRGKSKVKTWYQSAGSSKGYLCCHPKRLELLKNAEWVLCGTSTLQRRFTFKLHIGSNSQSFKHSNGVEALSFYEYMNEHAGIAQSV